MLSWATDQLEKLSQTVAPPPTYPTSRFLFMVQKNDEPAAQGCLAEIDPWHTVIQPTKGTLAIHLACFHSMMSLIRQLMAIPGANGQVVDTVGNTPLHHACMSKASPEAAMYVVKMLVIEYNVSVVCKNYQGQTPYDVATLSGIRQYLLPLQLQQETQQALDNGGIGLPPGIDMGGLRIAQPAMPPPPLGAAVGMKSPPPHQHYGPPPTHSMLATPSPNMPTPSSAPVPAALLQSGDGPPHAPQSAPTSGNRTYARTGSSSAAILAGSKFRPDGFHSSSSDVSLQLKYGHSNSGLASTAAAAVPPPPSSGNSSVGASSSDGTNPYAAGMSAFGGGTTVAARYGSARGRYPVYDAVTNQTSVAPAAVIAGPPVAYNVHAAPTPTYTMFQPGGAPFTQQQQQVQPQQQQQVFPLQQQQAAYQQPFSPAPQQQEQNQAAYPQPFLPPPQQNHTASYQQLFSPPPTQYQPQAATATPFMSPPPYSVAQPSSYQAKQQPQERPFNQPEQAAAGYQQTQPVQRSFPANVPAPAIPVPRSISQTSSIATSTASAEEIFSSPSPVARQEKIPAAESAARVVTSDDSTTTEQAAFNTAETSTEQAVENGAADEPASNPTALEAFTAPTAVEHTLTAAPMQATTANAPIAYGGPAAADFFGSTPAVLTQKVKAAYPSATTGSEAENNAREANSATPATEVLEDEPLDDVPLSPSDDGTTNGSRPMAEAPMQQASAAFSLPPPPFSSQQ